MTEKEVATETSAQEGNENGSKHEEDTELESSIIRQVEYYFGDANLPRDKFLREQVKLDEGWVPLDVLITFNRLAKLTTDTEVIGNALSKATSGLLEISEDNKKVRRHPEMPVPEMNEERRKELLGRTIYAKGFKKDAVLDDILKFFKEHGDISNVVMRRYIDKASKERKFKGSVFATFQSKEGAEKFVATKELKYEETELIVRWQEEYLKEKQEEYTARKEKKEKKPKHDNKESGGGGKEELKLPTGTVLRFTDTYDKLSREHVKEALTAAGGGEVAYIDYKLGDKEGWVRFSKENEAKEIIAKITDGKLKIGESEVTFKLLEGDEEKAYLDKTIEEMVKRRKNQRNNKHHGHGKGGNRNFKGKQQGRKRRHDRNEEDAPAAKVKAD